jgi:hypothetical protein
MKTPIDTNATMPSNAYPVSGGANSVVHGALERSPVDLNHTWAVIARLVPAPPIVEAQCRNNRGGHRIKSRGRQARP